MPQISENDKKMLCEPVTLAELKKALISLGNDKTPGLDGLTYEFYKHFWDQIGGYLLKSLNESLTTGELSLTQRQNIIRLIPKKRKRSFISEKLETAIFG